MNFFQKMKERVTARQVAERYGLKVSRNGMARCPFHNDKHPSMKIDRNYYCFACGAKGDAVNYVAVQFGLSQFEAAKKINEDFSVDLPIGTPGAKRKRKSEVKKKEKASTKEERMQFVQKKIDKWTTTTDFIEIKMTDQASSSTSPFKPDVVIRRGAVSIEISNTATEELLNKVGGLLHA